MSRLLTVSFFIYSRLSWHSSTRYCQTPESASDDPANKLGHGRFFKNMHYLTGVALVANSVKTWSLHVMCQEAPKSLKEICQIQVYPI